MYNKDNYYRSANQNNNDISPHTCQNGYHQKEHKKQMLARMWRKKPMYTVGGNVYWCSHCGKEYGGFSKLKIELQNDPAIPLLSIYPEKTKTLI